MSDQDLRDQNDISFILRDDPFGFRQGVSDAIVLPTYNAVLTAGQDWMIKLWKFDMVYYLFPRYPIYIRLAINFAFTLLSHVRRSLWNC